MVTHSAIQQTKNYLNITTSFKTPNNQEKFFDLHKYYRIIIL